MLEKVNSETFIARAKAKHGDRYDYSETVYESYHKKLRVICKRHSVFEVSPSNHLAGKNCPTCAIELAASKRCKSQEDVLRKFTEVHGDKYDYSDVVYTKSKTPVTIKCREHGIFKVQANAHIGGVVCSECSFKERKDRNSKKNFSLFIDKAKSVHGDKYNYDFVEYQNSVKPVEIECKKHDKFWQTPGNHIAGQGCPACSEGGFSNNISGYFYVLHYGDRVKVGITNRDPEVRARQISRSSKLSFSVLKGYLFCDGLSARLIESKVLKWLRETHRSEESVFSGSTECFIEVNKAALMQYVNEVVSQYNL